MRRRRSRGTWLPNIGTQIGEGDDFVQGTQFTNTVINGVTTGIFSLTFDVPQEGDDLSLTADTLSEVIGSEYVLQRIVGKVFIARRRVDASIEEIDNEPAVLVSAGFFVARANDTSSGGGSGTPIGSASGLERNSNYSPLVTDTVREPWIWRRSWILGAQGTTVGVGISAPITNPFIAQESTRLYPATTALYGSVADGPHIDSKVKRRVGNDNRLFFAVSSTSYPLNSPVGAENLNIQGYLDYRLFGSLRKARGTSAF